MVDFSKAKSAHQTAYLLGTPNFQEVPLAGNSNGAKVLEAAKRVRNNLFHGGKHTPHSPPARDTGLIEAALCVLQHCLEMDLDLAGEYEHQIA